MRMLGVGKDKDADLGLYQDGSGSNKRGETEEYCGTVAIGKGAGLLNSPVILNERNREMGQRAWDLASQLEATSQKKN